MPNEKGDSLDRDLQILDRLAKIEHKVDSIEQTNAFALRADAERHFAEVGKIFGTSIRRAQVYLAADGNRSVQEIGEHLSMQRQNVGSELRVLADEGLLELVESNSNRDIWAKKPIDRTLRITPFLCKKFSLGSDGLMITGAKQTRSKRRR